MVVFAATMAHGQNAKPEEEYKKLSRVSEDIQPLGEHPFGENISLYDGALSFEQVDVSASGTGPLLQLVRQFDLEGQAASFERSDYAFGDWDLDLPRIETLTAHGWYHNAVTGRDHEVTGWEVPVGAQDPNARCSQFSRPPTMTMYLGDPR
jgi:hypothetical protein